MREADAQAVLLVRAFEEADVEGRLLSPVVRSDASAEARASFRGRDAQIVVHRAWSLLPELEDKVPALRRLLAASRVGAGLGPAVVLLALIFGLVSNALGPDKRINVLFAPMLGMVLWNLIVYLLLVVLALRRPLPRRRARRPEPAADAPARPARASHPAPVVPAAVRDAALAAHGLIGRAAGWLVERTLNRPRARQLGNQPVVVSSLARFAQSWRTVSVALMETRLRRLLHLGAMALVLGAVAGMYWRGLGLEYGAVWESTFLDEHQVRSLTRLVLGPAAALLGRDVPDVAELNHKAGAAAPWIHLWVVTGLLFVVVPRTLLALWETLRERRLVEDLPLDLSAAYFRRLLAPGGGSSRRIDVLAYSHSLGARSRDALLALLHDVFGSRADVQLAAPLDYGAEVDDAAAALAANQGDETGRHAVLLFGLAQPPEIEVHGRIAEELRRHLGERALTVLVDGSTYRERVGTATERLAERRRAWDRVLREAGTSVVHVDLSRPAPDDVVAALAAAAGQGTGGAPPGSATSSAGAGTGTA